MKTNMNTTTSSKTRKRAYNQTARAEAAEATATRIVEVFHHLLMTEWYDSVSLDHVAKAAGVTVPTVLRRFGSKEGLLVAVRDKMQIETDARRRVPPGDMEAAIEVIISDYEESGDIMLRILAQEDRLPALKELADFGRVQHRRWISETFSPQLSAMKPAARELAIDSLMTALDIYVWKVLRCDRGRSRKEVSQVMGQFVKSILAGQ